MGLAVRWFLHAHGLDALQERYAIKARRHGVYPNLVLLKYDQIESPMGERIVQECRGLILDEADNWGIVSYPFDKFFNYGEGHAAAVDWDSARIYEKLDGALMVLYWYNGWQVASSGTPDGSGGVSGINLTFRELLWNVWRELGYRLPRATQFCYMFELMTPHNRVVVRHERNRLALLGVRNLETLEEDGPEFAAQLYGWEYARSFPFDSCHAVLVAARDLDPMDSEGYVVCDSAFRRVKMKSPQYVALAHMRDSFSLRRMLEVIRLNEGDEFLSYFPEWGGLYADLRGRYDGLCAEIEARYAEIKDVGEQKAFALEATKVPYSGILFSLRKGSIATAREGLAKMLIWNLETLLGVENRPEWPAGNEG